MLANTVARRAAPAKLCYTKPMTLLIRVALAFTVFFGPMVFALLGGLAGLFYGLNRDRGR